jgi:diguanylate cyclase (GGDEF)-like protein/PAS domain S-box-containing protein
MTDIPKRLPFSFLSPLPDVDTTPSDRRAAGNLRDFRLERLENERENDFLRESETYLKILLDNISEGLVILDTAGKMLFVNSFAEKLFHRPAANLVGEQLGIPIVIDRFSEVEIPCADGSFQRVSMRVLAFSWQGRPAYLAFLQDITELKRAEERLKILYQAVEQSAAAIAITDAQGKIEYVNSKYEKLTGYSADEAIAQKPGFLYREMPSELCIELQSASEQGLEWSGEYLDRTKNGKSFWERVSVAPIVAETGQITHFVAVKEDISDRKHQEDLLSYQASHDALTNLPNRSLAIDRLQQAINRAKRNGNRVGLLFIDLDHFKDVNDTLGHEYGDQLLQATAERLLRCLRTSDTVARLGGDEFLVILPELDYPDRCEPIARKLLGTLEIPFDLSGNEVFISASIGCTVYPDDGEDISSLLRNADIAMYGIKHEGRDGFKYFTPELNEKATYRVSLAHYLRHALDRDEMSIAYQPIIDLRSGRPIGAEALMRWDNPEYGRVSPARFIPIAEETGAIERLGAWILRESCAEAVHWQQGSYPLWVAVNVSPRQFRDVAFLDRLYQAIEVSGLSPSFLHLEVTEALLIEDIPRTTPILDRLHQMEISLSVDDFGTGYSALSYLRQFPFSGLKIDRSFIGDLPHDNEASTLVKTILAMAQALGLTTIAEGVETQEQAEFLLESGCDCAQGYYYSQPLNSLDFRQYIAQQVR